MMTFPGSSRVWMALYKNASTRQVGLFRHMAYKISLIILTNSRIFDNLKMFKISKKGDTRMNTVFEALSDPTRRKILEFLRVSDLSAGAIAERLPIGKSAVSHHLGKLKVAGLVDAEREGQSIIYSLNTTLFQEILTWIYGMRGEKTGDNNSQIPPAKGEKGDIK
jgi:ArsR family transcriptional regulator